MNDVPQATEARQMKLLVYSHFFAPSIGGVETMVFSLARAWSITDIKPSA